MNNSNNSEKCVSTILTDMIASTAIAVLAIAEAPAAIIPVAGISAGMAIGSLVKSLTESNTEDINRTW